MHPYVGFLFGVGTISYPSNTVYNDYVYDRSRSMVTSPGGGIYFDVNEKWSIQADFQWQHWNVPEIDAGQTRAESATIGFLYRWDRQPKKEIDLNDGSWQPLTKRYPGAGR